MSNSNPIPEAANLSLSGYGSVPKAAQLQPDKFEVSVSDQDLKDFKDLLRLSKLAPETYENLRPDGQYGVTHKWMTDAKSYWESEYDWRGTEKHINSFPNFTVQIQDDDSKDYKIHFVALFSKKAEAVPILFMHGWPGSFLEFLGIFAELKKRYSPENLPYHVIAPSLPGYTLSSGPPLDKDFTIVDIARIMNKLMVGLGFGSGYVAQGGDIGSFVCRPLGAKHDECKAVHANLCVIQPPTFAADEQLTEIEQRGLGRMQEFFKTGNGYGMEHGTRPATIGFVLSSSPLAQLAWIGEKFIQWTDETPPLKDILDSVTLYWFTQSFARCIYPYRQFYYTGPYPIHEMEEFYCKKPMGFSSFPQELTPIPKSWIATTGNLVWFKQHEKGGHFAAMERPKDLLDDVEDFVKQVWPV